MFWLTTTNFIQLHIFRVAIVTLGLQPLRIIGFSIFRVKTTKYVHIIYLFTYLHFVLCSYYLFIYLFTLCFMLPNYKLVQK